ncbi:MAG: hypothetical protein LPK85_14925, partial [Gammaproteobacteria bacterium]|nr:hypothetical protein [Gammaproteobacteria bacterium]
PPIALPLPVHLGALDLADLRVNGTSVTQDIHLAADFWAGHWQVHALRARYEDYAASLQGQLQPQDEWPLQVTGEVRLPPLHEQPWAIGLEGTGSVRNLVLKLTSQGYYAAQADAQIQPLSPGVPIRLHLLSDHLRADPAVPDTLVMQAVKLLAEGNLDDGFLVDLQAALPGIGQRIDLSLKGLVGLEDARIDSLQLSGTQAVDGRLPSLQLSGQVGWAQGLRLDTRARWQDFPWQALLAEAPEVPVRLRQAELDVKLEDARYTGTLNARLEGPAGPFSLTTPFAGDERRVALEGLNLRADQGVLSGRLDVGFADQLDWAYALRLDGLNPAFWVAELPGRLAGDLVGRGSLAGEALHLETTARVQGPLRDLPLDLALQARLAPGTLELPEARLRWGDNRIDAQAQWAQALEARLELALPALAQLWPGLQGQASGTLTLAGTPDDPRGRVELNAQGLGFADVRSESLNWQAELHPGQRLDSVLTLERLKAAGQSVRRAELRIDGGLDQHRIALTAQERRDRLALTLDGSWIQGLWQGTLSEARVQVARQDWQLEAPAALRVDPQRDVVLGEHCWQWEAARLCAEDQPLWPQTRIRLALTAFPLSWLADQWPGEARWKASLAAGVALDLLAEGPQGRIFIDAGHGELELPAGDAWVSLVHERFRVEAELTPATISLNADLFGPALGELQARVQLDPHAEDPVLEGEYRIHDLNLSLVQSVAPLETLEGALQGEGRLAGTLLAPRVFGGLSVVRGRVADPQLPLSLEDLTLDAQVEDQGLTLSGQWRSGERGQGTLDGELDWSGAELRGDLRLQ